MTISFLATDLVMTTLVRDNQVNKTLTITRLVMGQLGNHQVHRAVPAQEGQVKVNKVKFP